MCWNEYNVTWFEFVVDNVVAYSLVLSKQGVTY